MVVHICYLRTLVRWDVETDDSLGSHEAAPQHVQTRDHVSNQKEVEG